jgi:hypothetical protein
MKFESNFIAFPFFLSAAFLISQVSLIAQDRIRLG